MFSYKSWLPRRGLMSRVPRFRHKGKRQRSGAAPWRSSGNQIDTASFIKGKDLDDRTVSEVQRKFHAYARTSSFTKCKRMVVGSLSS